jgi:acyl-coenzyme A thioesterase PaaI-like protein
MNILTRSTTVNNINFTLNAWQHLSKWIAGKWLFSKLVCFKAPYFSSIHPQFISLRPGYCEVHIRKRRAVLNHIGTVHAIAMCNMAELAGGSLIDVTIPLTHRWIPKGMTVEYLKKATTSLRAIASIDPIPVFEAATDYPVTVNVMDTNNIVVFRAVIAMWISPKNK